MGRFSMVLVVGFAIIAVGLKLNYSRIGSSSQDVSNAQFSENSARNIARSAAELSIYQLSQDKNWRGGYSGLSLSSSSVDVEIVDSSQDSTLGADTVRIEIEAENYNDEVSSEVLVAVNAIDWPGNITAGVTAQCDILTLGQLVIDGRDHDMQGNLFPDDGVFAIRTMGDFTRQGSSKLGGTKSDGIDLEPTKWFGWEQVAEEYMSWPGGFPSEPDQVIGVPLGTLKGLAQGGVNGGQYVIDPSNLTFPLSGVTYVELPSDSLWEPAFFRELSEGILVVHNDDTNALMSNLTGEDFKGLIIADDMVHMHNTIIGAIFLLTVGPSGGNCIGNGTGDVLFSKEAIYAGLNNGGLKGDSLWVMSYYE